MLREQKDNSHLLGKRIEAATRFLQTSSEEISTLVDSGNFKEASKIIKKFTSDLMPRLQKLGDELKHLANFKKEITGTK